MKERKEDGKGGKLMEEHQLNVMLNRLVGLMS